MTYEEVLENIKSDICYNQPMCADGICKGTEENPCAIDIALDCIEKQIPKKPNTREQGSTTVTRGFCTECLRSVFSFDSYCPDCGQAIDWSDVYVI